MACSHRNNVFEITARTIHAWNNKTLQNLRWLCQIMSSITEEILI